MALLKSRTTLSPTFVFDTPTSTNDNSTNSGGGSSSGYSQLIDTFYGDVEGKVTSKDVLLNLKSIHNGVSESCKVTYNEKGLVISGTSLSDSDIPLSIARREYLDNRLDSLLSGISNTFTYSFDSSLITINHNQNCKDFVCQVNDENGFSLSAKKIIAVDENNIQLIFTKKVKGRATICFDKPQLIPDNNKRTFLFENKKGELLIQHDMNSINVICEVKNNNNEKISPNIIIVDENTLKLIFTDTTSGRITVIFDKGVPINVY